ncbi:hypothetical protein H4R99_000661 [Coemansia sp. RSA 1722]|nr:hypothetical protein IWW45_000545 [Coemansia sp. RSA 485]KAJ2606108.1 hypothetical protein H4R99_000661 [Coemansia sp. RSA 1722]
MQFFKSTIFAALVSLAAAQSVNWQSADSLACAQSEWASIKAAVDPQLKSTWNFLPPVFKNMLADAGALSSDNTLVSTAPSAEAITRIAQFPLAGVFSPYADNVVLQCLATYVPSSEEPSSSSSTEESSSSSTEEPSSSSSSTEEESSSSTEEESSSSTSDEEQQSSTSDEEESSSTSSEEEQPSSETSESYTSSEPHYSVSSTTHKCRPRPTQ